MKLDIGTSLNLVFDPSYKKPITQQLDSVCGAGFKHIDMNFLDWCHGEKSPFTSENWQDWILQIKEYGEKSKITFHQAHAPMYSYKDGKSPLDFDEHFDKMTIRSIQAAGMLGVKWIIIHAGHYPHKPYNRSMSNQLKEANFAWFGQFFNEAQKWNVGIAIENMANVFAPKLEGIEN